MIALYGSAVNADFMKILCIPFILCNTLSELLQIAQPAAFSLEEDDPGECCDMLELLAMR